MNRLRTAWNVLWGREQAVEAMRVQVTDSRRAVKDQRNKLVAADDEAERLRQELQFAEREIQRLEDELRASNLDSERLQQNIDLLEASLEYQLQWRQREVERMRMEQAMLIRARMEATSAPDRDGFAGLEG